MSRGNRGIRRWLVLLVVGLALGLFTLALARSGAGFSLALSTTFGAIALLSAGWSLMTAGLILGLNRRPMAMSLLLYGGGFAWFLAEWDNPAAGSQLIFSAGLSLFAACSAVVGHLALAYPSGRLGSRAAQLVVLAGYTITVGVLGVASAIVFSPESHGCSDCPSNLLLTTDQPALWIELNRWGVRLATAWAAVATTVITWRLLRASSASRRSFGLVSVCALGYLGSVLVYYADSLDRGFLGGDRGDAQLWLIQATTLVLLSVAVVVDVLRARLTHRALTALVIELGESGPTGHLRDALAARLDDPDLVIGYPVDRQGRFVDAMAQEVALPAPHGRTTTTLRYGGADVGILIHRPGLLDSPEAVDDLVSAIRLGLENERLQAEVLRQLADLGSSGARILATGDDERRRLERDLHDGAQQRLVGLSLGLRLLRSQLRSSEPKLDRAEQELQEAIAELRQLARGLYPAVLTDQGLPAALNALAESRHVRVESLPSGRLPAVIESTAYLLVARAVHSGRATIESTFHDGALVMDVTVQAEAIDLGEVPDRVKTLGGALDVSRLQSGATLAELRLPVEHAARS